MIITSKGFSDKVFYRNLLMVVLAAAISIYVIFHTLTGYAAMSAVAISSFAIGILEPRRGWALALIYSLIVVIFWLIHPIKPFSEDLAMFSSYLSIFMSLGFGFVIGLLNRMFEK